MIDSDSGQGCVPFRGCGCEGDAAGLAAAIAVAELLVSVGSAEAYEHDANAIWRLPDGRYVHAECGGCSCGGSGSWSYEATEEAAMRRIPKHYADDIAARKDNMAKELTELCAHGRYIERCVDCGAEPLCASVAKRPDATAPVSRSFDFFEADANRMQFAVELPVGHVIRYAYMVPRVAKIRGLNGKAPPATLVPVVAYDYDPASPTAKYHFAYCPAGQTFSAQAPRVEYRATLIHPQTGDAIALFELFPLPESAPASEDLA